mgnify:CR=1 FL=1
MVVNVKRKGLIAAVGALGLLTSLSMSVFERQKEIGVMRSVGASNGAIMELVIVEGVLTGVLSWLCASLAGLEKALLEETSEELPNNPAKPTSPNPGGSP